MPSDLARSAVNRLSFVLCDNRRRGRHSRPTRSTAAGAAGPVPRSDPDFMLSLARGPVGDSRVWRRPRAADRGRRRDGSRSLSRASARRCLHTLSRARLRRRRPTAAYELTPAILTLGQAYLESATRRARRAARPRAASRTSSTSPPRSPCSMATRSSTSRARRLGASCRSACRSAAGCRPRARRWAACSWPPPTTRRARGSSRRVKLVRYTDRTITGQARARGELDAVKRQGYAIVDQELELGLRACAVPIARPDGTVVAALNVGVHVGTRRCRDAEARLAAALRQAAEEISAGLGAGRSRTSQSVSGACCSAVYLCDAVRTPFGRYGGALCGRSDRRPGGRAAAGARAREMPASTGTRSTT